jgi:bis(5'-nucleosyl)-tetraphosphatase (symmetrical)
MPTYAIGDIQGCFSAVQKLLDAIHFDPERDRLWLVGDLVNRGTQSLATLRWVKAMGSSVITVLGNHDLHLLAVAEGFVKPHRLDTIQDILEAPDRHELLDWLRCQPLLHREGGFVLVHAGLLPHWSPQQARELAGEVEAALRADNYREFLGHMYGNHPDHWQDDLTGMGRLRVITNAMTRLRFCTPEGKMEFVHKGGLDKTPEGFMPWFEVPGRKSADETVIWGHWSALGLKLTENLAALDTGCLWGGMLSALRLQDRQVFQVSCKDSPGTIDWK